jgi:hypothetical protein
VRDEQASVEDRCPTHVTPYFGARRLFLIAPCWNLARMDPDVPFVYGFKLEARQGDGRGV